jgi:DNA (cytosine-5)-methyltransferase 1
LNAGIKVILGVDVNEDCRITYKSNNKPADFLAVDVRQFGAEDVAHYRFGQRKEPLLLAGCAPCQPFSSHRRSGRSSNNRNLLREVSRIASELNPEWIFIENVPGLARVPGWSTYRRFKQELANLGYRHADGVVDAKAYGVPQTRRRLVLLASRICNPTLPPATHGPTLKPYATVRSAIACFPPLNAGERHPAVNNHFASEILSANLERLKYTPHDGGSRTDWPKRLVLECHKKPNSGHEDVYGRMHWNEPAPTLTCRCFSISNGRYGHPEQDRAISFREAASLQSFPSTYTFYGETQKSIGMQIGNAVPVLLAQAVGQHILKLAESST